MKEGATSSKPVEASFSVRYVEKWLETEQFLEPRL